MSGGPDAKPRSGSLIGRHSKVTLAIAVVLGLTASMILRQWPADRLKVGRTQVVEAVLTDPGSPSVGPAGAEVTIVIFTDYQCPVCRGTDGALDRVRRADRGVRVIYKDWPILGEASRFAARVALAADRQGRYVAVHNALMQTRRPLDLEGVRQVVIQAGVDWPRLEADLRLHGPEIDAQLARHDGQAWSLGIEGTPAYLVGPFLVRGGLSEGALKAAIVAARKAGAQ